MKFKIPDTPEELFRDSGKNLARYQGWIPFIFLLVVIAFIALTSFYSIAPDEVGVVKRFGKYIRTTEPGLHWKWPLGIEDLVKVKVKHVFKEEFGFRTERAGVNTRYSQANFNDESLMLTGDLNVLDVTWIVQFKIKDPVAASFNVRSLRATIRDLSEAVMRQVIGDSTVSEGLNTRRVEINLEVQEKLQEILDSYNSGIQIDTVKLQDVNPPGPVQPSFNEVNEAKQEKEKVINQAWETYNKIIPKARGEAEKTIREAEGYTLARVNQAKGDASRFVDVWQAYQQAKDVTRRRMYLETLQEIFQRTDKLHVLSPGADRVLPFLDLGQPTQPKAREQ